MASAYLKDLAERVVSTFIQGAAGSFVVVDLTDKNMWLAALGGGVAAVASLLKGLLAKGVGNDTSASLSRDV